MTNQLRPYAAYKASGFEWLGKVPAHWQIRQLGRIGRFFKGGGGTKGCFRHQLLLPPPLSRSNQTA